MKESEEMKARLQAEMMAGKHAAALKQMALIMTSMMRGEKAVILQAMRMTMAEDIRNRELAQMQAQSDAQMRSAAIREMRAIMMRLAKGEVAGFMEVCRTNKKWAMLKAQRA